MYFLLSLKSEATLQSNCIPDYLQDQRDFTVCKHLYYLQNQRETIQSVSISIISKIRETSQSVSILYYFLDQRKIHAAIRPVKRINEIDSLAYAELLVDPVLVIVPGIVSL